MCSCDAAARSPAQAQADPPNRRSGTPSTKPATSWANSGSGALECAAVCMEWRLVVLCRSPCTWSTPVHLALSVVRRCCWCALFVPEKARTTSRSEGSLLQRSSLHPIVPSCSAQGAVHRSSCLRPPANRDFRGRSAGLLWHTLLGTEGWTSGVRRFGSPDEGGREELASLVRHEAANVARNRKQKGYVGC